MGTHLKQFLRERCRLVALVLLLATSVLATANQARAIDTDGNGFHDALLREMPYLPYANVGAMCTVYYSNGAWRARLTVRPPRVWSLWNQYNQTVAWAVRFVSATGRIEAEAFGAYSTASPNQHTDFGGGPNAPQVSISSSSYWAGSKYADHPIDTTPTVKPVVVVYWKDARTGLWTSMELPVAYYYMTHTNVVQPFASSSGC